MITVTANQFAGSIIAWSATCILAGTCVGAVAKSLWASRQLERREREADNAASTKAL